VSGPELIEGLGNISSNRGCDFNHKVAQTVMISSSWKIPHSNGFSGSPRGLGCRERLAPWFPVATQPSEALHHQMKSQITSTISMA